MMSCVSPSARYSRAGSSPWFWNGSTAMAGFAACDRSGADASLQNLGTSHSTSERESHRERRQDSVFPAKAERMPAARLAPVGWRFRSFEAIAAARHRVMRRAPVSPSARRNSPMLCTSVSSVTTRFGQTAASSSSLAISRPGCWTRYGRTAKVFGRSAIRGHRAAGSRGADRARSGRRSAAAPRCRLAGCPSLAIMTAELDRSAIGAGVQRVAREWTASTPLRRADPR